MGKTRFSVRLLGTATIRLSPGFSAEYSVKNNVQDTHTRDTGPETTGTLCRETVARVSRGRKFRRDERWQFKRTRTSRLSSFSRVPIAVRSEKNSMIKLHITSPAVGHRNDSNARRTAEDSRRSTTPFVDDDVCARINVITRVSNSEEHPVRVRI